jgi:protein-S-isoprenylcysteine O-methyltransferase Ste14
MRAMPGAALLIYLAWFALTGLARALISRRMTGDSGWRGFSGRPLSIEWLAGVGFGVALVVGVAATIAALAGLAPLFDSTHAALVGIVIAVVGVPTTLAVQLAMGPSWRVGVDEDERTALVVEGPFTVVRNPIFTAMVLTTVGLTLMVPNVVAIAGLIILVTGFEVQVRRVEEPYLLAAHGDRYAAYAAAVGRFLPGLGRLAPA